MQSGYTPYQPNQFSNYGPGGHSMGFNSHNNNYNGQQNIIAGPP